MIEGYDIKPRIVFRGDNKSCCEHEIFLIKSIGRITLGHGSLINILGGGDGRISEDVTGQQNPASKTNMSKEKRLANSKGTI